MKSEQELRELRDDIDLLNEEYYRANLGPGIADAFLHGIAVGLNEALDSQREGCGNPSCKQNHAAERVASLAGYRKRAAAIRAQRAAREKAQRQ
jgi:hypothetical protein